MGHFNFWLSLSLSDSLSKTLSWTLKSGLRPKFNKFGLNLSLSEITLLFDLSLYLDRALAQRKAHLKAKSKVKVAQCKVHCSIATVVVLNKICGIIYYLKCVGPDKKLQLLGVNVSVWLSPSIHKSFIISVPNLHPVHFMQLDVCGPNVKYSSKLNCLRVIFQNSVPCHGKLSQFCSSRLHPVK